MFAYVGIRNHKIRLIDEISFNLDQKVLKVVVCWARDSDPNQEL